MSIVVSSTTDTAEQVNQAAGVTQEEEEIKSTETKLEGDEQVDSGEPEEKVEPEPKPEVTPKADKYIKKLTARAKSAEERLAALETELAEARKSKPTATVDNRDDKPAPIADAPADVAADPEPKQDDPKFKTYEDWIKAQARWEVRQERREEEQKQQKAAQDAEAKQVVTTYNAEVASFKKEVDDWDEVVGGSTVQIQVGVQNALMEMARPDVVYFIASHPETAKELWAMPPARAIAEVGRIAAKLEAPPKEEVQGERKSGPDKLPVSSAPPPIRGLSGHATRSKEPIDQLSYSDYRKIRDAEEKQRFRR